MVAIATPRSCHRCIRLETEYEAARSDLRDKKARSRVPVILLDEYFVQLVDTVSPQSS